MALSEKTLNSQVDNFASQIIALAKFRIKTNELGKKYDNLIEDKLVEVVGDEIQVLKPEPFAQALVHKFKQKFNFSVSSNPKALSIFINKIESFFPDGPMMGRTQLYDAMREIVIGEFADIGGSLLKFVKQYAGDRKIYSVAKAIGNTIPKTKLKVTDVIALIIWLSEEIQSKMPGTIDTNINALGNSLFRLCLEQPVKGREIYKKYVLAKKTALKNFHPGILSAMFELDPGFFEELTKLSKVPSLAADAVCSLGSVCNRPDTDLHEKTLDLLENIIFSMDFQTLCQVPGVLGVIVKQSIGKSSVIERSFNLWEKIVAADEKALPFVISELSFIAGQDVRIASMMKNLILDYEMDEAIVNQLQYIFYEFKDASAGFKIINALEQKQKLKYHRNLQEVVDTLQQNDPVGCDRELVKLLTDDSGYQRFFGRRLLNHLSSRSKTSWAINVLELDGLDQYKLCLAITDDFKEPKYIIPFVVGLMDSQHRLVRELLLHRLQIMTQNYFSDVEESLTLYVDDANALHVEIMIEVKNYHNQFVARLDRKWKIKELDPRYTHSKYFRSFYRLQQKSFQQNIDEGSKKDSLRSLFSNVMLGKGGGFRMGQKDKVQQLAKIEVKMSLPREYFIAPESYDWNMKVEIINDWKNKFNTVRKDIENG